VQQEEPPYLLATRDYLCRSTRCRPADNPAFFHLLDTAVACVEPGLEQPFFLECSLRVSPQVTSWDRYVVAFSGAQFGRTVMRTVERLARATAPGSAPLPALVAKWIAQLQQTGLYPAAFLAGIAGQPGQADAVGKLYLEQRPLDLMLGVDVGEPVGSGRVAALSAEWPIGATTTITRLYRELPVDPWPDLNYHLAPSAGGTALTVPVDLQRQIANVLVARRIFVRSDLGLPQGQSAQAVQWLGPGVPITDVLPVLQRLGQLLDLPFDAWSMLANEVPEAHVRVLGLGTTRGGAPHLTVYHSPPPVMSRTVAAGAAPGTTVSPQASAQRQDHPGQVVLVLVTGQGTPAGSLVVAKKLPQHNVLFHGGLTVFPSARCDPKVLRAAPEVVACLAGQDQTTLAARVAGAEAALQAILAQHGLRLDRFTALTESAQ